MALQLPTNSTLMKIIMSLIAICLLLWSITFGYQTVTQPQEQLWITVVAVLLMLCGFYLMAKGIHIIVELIVRDLSREEDHEIHENC
jgi:hypothetical protein